MSVQITPPQQVSAILEKLAKNGFEAYLVGGCVRDCLLGMDPIDWDLTTNARPEQVKKVFAAYPVLETGIRHGTVTVLLDHVPIEVTTYRSDIGYTDHRHPDAVRFTPDLREDLARRDFTVNALAWSPETGFIDYFNGINDLAQRCLRCVGEASVRFEEDALRILRALRFSSVLGFSISPDTSAAIHQKKELLSFVAAERVQKELSRCLCGKNIQEILLDYPDVLSLFIPQLSRMKGFEQHNPHHVYDILEHTAKAVSVIEPDPVLRLAMLFHDTGKPDCFSIDEDGVGHFYGHAQKSVQIAKKALQTLRFDRTTIENVLFLVKYHDTMLPTERKGIKRWLNRFGETKLRLLLPVKYADTLALAPEYHHRLSELHDFSEMLETLLQEQACFSVSQLAVNGNDLIQAGVTKGPQVGVALEFLLNAVIEEFVPNDREQLLKYWKEQKGTDQ